MMVIGNILLGSSLALVNLAGMPGDEINPLVRERIAVQPLSPQYNRVFPVQMTVPSSAQHGNESVRVQVNVNLFVPGPGDESEAAEKVRDHARRSIYQMAAHECDLVRDVLAKECRLQAISVNVMRQQMGNMGSGYNVSGNFTLQVTLKEQP
jgi:hypothetical protein